MLRLKTFGTLRLTAEASRGLSPHPRRLALLALLAASGERGLTRDQLVAYLWPESAADTARHSLEQLLHAMRKALGETIFSGVNPVFLNSAVVSSDVGEFERAISHSNWADAVAVYDGPFLSGFYLEDAAEFERWTEIERARLADRFADALRRLATEAERVRDFNGAVRWWRRLVDCDPLSSRSTLALMRALAAAGDRAAALQHARIHEALVMQELESAPDPSIAAFAAELRAAADVTPVAPQAAASAVAPAATSAPPPPADAAADRATDTPPVETRRVPAGRRARYVAGIVTILAATVVALLVQRQRGRAATPASVNESIAVIPLAGADPASESLSDGIAEELIDQLTAMGGLRVIARTSSFAFKGHPTDLRRIADSLTVTKVLELGLQRDGSRMRVRVRLVDGKSGLARWSQTYTGEMKDVFAVQDSIGRMVARALNLQLLASANTHRAKHQTSVEAYESYLRGRDEALLRTDSGKRMAQDYLRRAVAADSTFAAGWAALAHVYASTSIGTGGPESLHREQRALALAAARRALSLDGSLPEAHVELGFTQLANLDLAAASAEFDTAFSLDPSDRHLREYRALIFAWTGRQSEQLAEMQRAKDLDPLSASPRAELARALIFSRRYDDALAELRTIRKLRPPLRRTAMLAGISYGMKNMFPQAIAAFRAVAGPGFPDATALLGNALARSGDSAAAKKILADLTSDYRHGNGGAFQVAMVLDGLGDRDHAFEWLDKSIDDRSLRLLVMSPIFDSLRADPRFEVVRRRLGLSKL